ncbi:ribosomal RNA small subunit methyltransferase H [Clostridia bacterium]|nr:ribosomal RNA small subunit methyltransferase H [Clostridia bacterium]
MDKLHSDIFSFQLSLKNDMQYHTPVLLDEVIKNLAIKPDGVYADGTLGGGGHAEAILTACPTCRLIGIDRDGEAIEYAGNRLKPYADRFTAVRGNFKDIDAILDGLNVNRIDGALLDLGISSRQIDSAERGFAYSADAPLDMRMDKRQSLTARDVVNGYGEAELVRLLKEYGEEDFARGIARAIVRGRTIRPIETTGELARIVTEAVPKKFRFGGAPKKTFQAVRIEVNAELDGLQEALQCYIDRLKTGGRLAVISFHSLEDRAGKTVFKYNATDCVCDKSLPVCVCGHRAGVKQICGPVRATEREIADNPRSASAKLRVVEKL